MSEKLDRFVELLRKIFELDKSDLDFGIYRIMNIRKGQIDDFLSKRLPEQVRDILQPIADNTNEIRRKMAELKTQAARFDADIESNKEYIALKEQLSSSADISALETDVYSYLYSFFNRYYDEGDFISKQAWLLKLALGLHVHIMGCSFKGIVSVMAADFPQLRSANHDDCRQLMNTLDTAPLQWSEKETVDNQSFSMCYTKDTSDNLIVRVDFYKVISAYFHYYSFLSQKHGDYIQNKGATLWEAPYDSELVRRTVCNFIRDDEGVTSTEATNIICGFENSHNKKLHYLNLQALHLYADNQGVSVRELLKNSENK